MNQVVIRNSSVAIQIAVGPNTICWPVRCNHGKIGGGIPAALYGIDQYVMPLELIGTRIAEKTGIDEIIRLIEQRF